jgi:hypothetical protein
MYYITNCSSNNINCNKLVRSIGFSNSFKSVLVEDVFDYNNLAWYMLNDLIPIYNSVKLNIQTEKQLLGEDLYKYLI